MPENESDNHEAMAQLKDPRAVVVLGAGSSADFGVPTLAGLFKDRQARRHLQRSPKLRKMLEDTFWTPRGQNIETSDRCLTVEDMLTLLRDWEKEDDLPKGSRPPDLELFRRRLYILIERAIYEGKSTKSGYLNPLLNVCRSAFRHTTWASFNWDCIFEASFWYSQMRMDCRVNPSLAVDVKDWYAGDTRHLLLKLHGGINWWMVNDRVTYLKWSRGGELEQKWQEFNEDPQMKDYPVILEPSFYKYTDTPFQLLHPQWRASFEMMLRADCIIVVGYSLPESDTLARSKLLTAFQLNPSCRWLIVDSSDSICDRYRRLLGTQRVTVMPMSLAAFNNNIRENLEDAFPVVDFGNE